MSPSRLPSDQAVRSAVLSQWEKPVAVDASAGTGKTRLLLDRLMVLLLERRVPLSRIAAITFTEKAAGELSSRLRQRLEQEWKSRLEQRPTLERALEDLESSPIGTIHSFCTGMLREHALVAGLDPRFTVMDAPSSEAFADETWETWLRGLEETPALSRALSMGTRPNSLRDLKNRLLRSRASLRKPVASPLPQEEEADRILQKGLDLFDALLARCHVEDDSLVKKAGENRKLWHETSQTTGEEKVLETGLLEAFSSTRAGNKKNWGDVPLAEAREGLQRLWEDLEAFTSRTRDSVMTGLLETLWGWVEYHQVEKRRRGVLDFDDLLILSRDLLTKDASARESLRRRHDVLLVDEFQDTDPLQAEIVFRLCEKSGTFAPDWRQASLQGGKLMVVGDPKQSIYRFRRADVEVYNEVLKALSAASGRDAFVLSENFRSSPALMRWVHGVFGSRFADRSERWAEPSAFRVEPLEEGALPPITALRVELPEKTSADGRRRREASVVAAHLKGLLGKKGLKVWDRSTGGLRPFRAGDIAILFKDLSNNEEPYEEALRSAGVPHQVVGGKKFYRRSEIVALANLLTAMDSPADEAAVVAVLRGPVFGFADGDLTEHQAKGGHFRYLEPGGDRGCPAMLPAFALLRTLREKTARWTVAESIRALLSETPLLAVTLAEPYGEQRAANLWKVADQASALESTEALTFRSFAQWLRQRRDEETMEGEAPGPESVGDRVLLMTVHQSKGLEYPLVVVPNADVKPKAGTFLPHRTRGTVEVSQGDLSTRGFEKAQEDEEAELRAENLRLLYVACTRAQDALVFPWQADTKEDGFLHPVVEGWDWEKDVDGTIRHLSCGTDLSVAEPSDDPGGRDPLAYRMAYDPSEVEGPEAEEWAGKFSARDEARREEVQRHLKTPRHRTAHEQDFEDARPLTRDDTPSRTASPWGHGSSDGFAFGRLVHRLLEWSGRPEVDRGTAGLWAKALGMSAKRAEEAFQAVQSWEASDLGKRLRASTQVFRELPVTLVREGESRDGRIDLAFLEDGKWVLVDYKTDRDMEERTEQYGTQVRFYAGLLEEATGRRVKEAWLVFVRPGGKPPVVQRVDL